MQHGLTLRVATIRLLAFLCVFVSLGANQSQAAGAYVCDVVARGAIRLQSWQAKPTEYSAIGNRLEDLADYLQGQSRLIPGTPATDGEILQKQINRDVVAEFRLDEKTLRALAAELKGETTLVQGERIEVHLLPLVDADRILAEAGQADLDRYQRQAVLEAFTAGSVLLSPLLVAAISLQQVLPADQAIWMNNLSAVLAVAVAKIVGDSVISTSGELDAASTPVGAVVLSAVLSNPDFSNLFHEGAALEFARNWTNHFVAYSADFSVKVSKYGLGGRKDPTYVSYALLPDLSDPMNYSKAKLVVVRKFTKSQLHQP